MIRLAIIGCGTWGRNYIASAIEAGNCRVTHASGAARGEVLPGSVVQVSSHEWRRLLGAPVDAFVVATPPSVRAAICADILELGRPVLAEKPLALSLPHAIDIALAAEQSGAPLVTMHQHLFAPAYEELLNLSTGWGTVGVASGGGSVGPHRSYSALWDYGPHDVSMFLGLGAGRPVTVDSVDVSGGLYRLTVRNSRAGGLLRVWNDRQPKTRKFAVAGDSGVLVYDDLDPDGRRLRLNGARVSVTPENPLARALRAFASVAAGGPQDWRTRPELGVDVVRVLHVAESITKMRGGVGSSPKETAR